MSDALEYVENIRDTVKSFWHGMSITLSHMFRRPMTIQYPDRTEMPVRDMLPPRYRGFLEVDVNVCTACQACERACPIGCIAIEVEKDPANPKQRVMTRFDIDAAKCMYCGLCVEPCPTGAIHHTREFEATKTRVDNLTFRFINPLRPVPPYKVVKGVDPVLRPEGEIVREQMRAWDAVSPFDEPLEVSLKAAAAAAEKAAKAAPPPAPAPAPKAEAAAPKTEAVAPKSEAAPAQSTPAEAKPAEAAKSESAEAPKAPANEKQEK